MPDKIGRTKVTSADCVLPEMAGKYDLVFYASQRARAITSGSPVLVTGFEKPASQSILVALEEIRQKKLRFEDLMESLISPFVEDEREMDGYGSKTLENMNVSLEEDAEEEDEDEEGKLDDEEDLEEEEGEI